MRRRILFFIFSLGLALIVSVAWLLPDKRQAANTPQGEATGNEEKGASQAAGAEESKWVQATGRVRLVGSGAFSELVITQENKQWYIAKEEIDQLNALQQQTVTLEGEETIRELKWANGRPAGMRRYLHNIKIIHVE